MPECLVIGELSQRSSWIRLLSGVESQSSSVGTKRTDAQSVQKKIHLMHLLRIHTVYIYKNWHQTLVVWCVFIKTEHFQTAMFNLIAVSKIIPLLEGYVKVKEPFQFSLCPLYFCSRLTTFRVLCSAPVSLSVLVVNPPIHPSWRILENHPTTSFLN